MGFGLCGTVLTFSGLLSETSLQIRRQSGFLTECADLVFFLSLPLKLEVISGVKTWSAVWRDSSVAASKLDLFLLSKRINCLSLPICSGPGISPQEGLGGGWRCV